MIKDALPKSEGIVVQYFSDLHLEFLKSFDTDFKAVGAIIILVYGYSLTVLNTAYEVVRQVNGWPKNSQRESIATAMVPIGGTIGCITGSSLIFVGRRLLIIYSNLLLVASITITLISSYWMLVVGRLIMGLATGLLSFIIFIYPIEIAGGLGGVFVICTRLGILLSFLVGLALPLPTEVISGSSQSWRVVLGFPYVFAAVMLVGFIFFIPQESPKGSYLKKQIDSAKSMLARIYTDPVRQNKEYLEIERIVKESAGKEVPFKALFSPEFRYAMVTACVLKTFPVLMGYSILIMYSTSIFAGSGENYDPVAGRLATVFIGLGNLIAVSIAAFVMNKLGRRLIFLVGSCSIVMMNIAVGFAIHYSWMWLARISVILFVLLYASTLGPLFWILGSEVVPARGVSFCTSIDWITTALGAYLFRMVEEKIGVFASFWIFACFNFFAALFGSLFLHETMGKKEAMIRYLYSPASIRRTRRGEFH